MLRRSSMSVMAAVLTLALWSPEVSAAQDSALHVVAFEKVTVIPMDRERTIEDQTVVIRGRRIAEIGPSRRVRVPRGATRIDGTGKYLIPGLAEMHGHIPSPDGGEEVIDRVLMLFLANGITTVRGMLGHPYHLQLRSQIARGERLGPQFFAAGPSINGRSVPNVDVAWRVVTEHRAAGFDLLKIHPGLTREVYDQVAATAKREGIPFAGHVPADVGLERALMAGQASIEHVDGYIEAIVADDAEVDTRSSAFFGFNLIDDVDESKIPDIAAATRAAGAWVTPTQVLFENRFLGDPRRTAQRPEMRYVSDDVLRQWVEGTRNARERLGVTDEKARRFIELRRKLIKALHDAGVGILLGADAPQVFNVPGYATLQELEALVTAGLTPYQALEAGTRNPALYSGKENSFGTVQVGMRADLILLDANPLSDISNVKRRSGVMVAGRWLPTEELQRRLNDLVSDR